MRLDGVRLHGNRYQVLAIHKFCRFNRVIRNHQGLVGFFLHRYLGFLGHLETYLKYSCSCKLLSAPWNNNISRAVRVANFEIFLMREQDEWFYLDAGVLGVLCFRSNPHGRSVGFRGDREILKFLVFEGREKCLYLEGALKKVEIMPSREDFQPRQR